MSAFRLAAAEPEDLLTLENKTCAVGIDRKTGWIRSLRWKAKEVDLFRQVRGGIPGYIGGLRVYDEHDRRWYSDFGAFTVRGLRRHGRTVTFVKRFEGAPFELAVTLRMDADALHWEVAAEKLDRKVADRSLRVCFFLPLIAGWDVWAPCKHGEKTFDGMTPFEFMYTQIPYVSDQEVILPMVSHYHNRLGVGFSVVEPIDANVPAAKFVFNNGEKCFNWGSMHKDPLDVPVLETVNYYIGLVGARKMETKIMVFFHEADWRPGLGRVYRRWKKYFDPFNPAIYDREGVFMCGDVFVSDRVQDWLRLGLKTLEVHGHFQDYCDYFQEGKDEWYSIGAKETLRRKLLDDQARANARGESPTSAPIEQQVEEYLATHTPEQVAAKTGLDMAQVVLKRADIERRLKILTDAGIACHWYFNYTDGYRPRVEKDWPDSISRDEDGAPIPSGWYMSHSMNADPRWSFGRFTIRSARKIFDKYPMLKGFFLDCFRHYEIDFAHDDGVTVVNGKPCYSMNRSYDDIERHIKTKIMKPRNLTSFANKPQSIRSMRYVDGQLLEGDGDQYEEKYFWGSIASPLFFMWTSGRASLDENLRRAVLHGCYPRQPDRLNEETIALYRRYLPLYAQFRRRVFCFESDPLRVPEGSRGKLYTVSDGYVAGIVNLHVSDRDRVKWARRPYALFRVRRAHDVVRAWVIYPGDPEPRVVPFKFDGTFLAVPMDAYRNCAVVRLVVEGDSGRAIGPEIWEQRASMCGDPDSSFEDLSER